jgi:hypothetical protein
MTAPVWQPGFLYQPGDLVRPASAPAASSAVIPNAGFESGDVSWTKTNVTIVNEAGSYAGDWHAKFVYAGGASGFVAMSTPVAVKPGQSITASCYIRATGPDQVGGDINIVWLDAAQALISVSQGNEVNTSNGQAWKKSSVTASAPANAAYCYLQGDAFALQANGVVRFDQFSWNYVPPVDSTLIYKAVQAEAGFSDSSEPAWPGVLGQQVIDNEVIWEAVNTSRVVWEASPILKSGTVEPTWPTEPGAFVADGSISWECVSRHVEQAPRSKVVVIAAKKVFAADRDIVRFSATVNPLDWTSENDAGYLPTGLQSGNANEMTVLATYRNNVVAMNPNGFQMWQVDPDPSLMALLDEKPGVGSSWQHAAQPVANELLYLSQRGVRSIGIAAASENLAAGDVGEPVDPLVMAALTSPPVEEGGISPISTYYPGAGQYWLAFRDCEAPGLSGDLPDGPVGEDVNYQYTVSPAYNGQTYTVSVTSGALPAGLSMDSTGLVTGTRTDQGVYSWTVTVTSLCGNASITDESETRLVPALLNNANEYVGPPSALTLSALNQFPITTGFGNYDHREPAAATPDGLVLAMASNTGTGVIQIFRWDETTKAYIQQTITGDAAISSYQFVSVSDDGEWVYTVSSGGGTYRAYKHNGSGYTLMSSQTLPVSGGGHGYCCTLSPNNTQLIYNWASTLRVYDISPVDGSLTTNRSAANGFNPGFADYIFLDWVDDLILASSGTGGAPQAAIYRADTLALVTSATLGMVTHSKAHFNAAKTHLYYVWRNTSTGDQEVRVASFDGSTITVPSSGVDTVANAGDRIIINGARTHLFRDNGKVIEVNGGTLNVLPVLPSATTNVQANLWTNLK